MTPHIRLFWGFDTQPQQAELLACQQRLAGPDSGPGVPAVNLHLTLLFLGSVPLGTLEALILLTNSTLAEFKLFGMTMFDLFDYLSSNIILPAGGIFVALFVGWVWGLGPLQQALSNQGTLNNASLVRVLFFLLRYVSPVLILVVMLKGLGLF